MPARRKMLHVLKTPPDELQRILMCSLSRGYNCLQIPLFDDDGEVCDYDELIDLIFEYDEVVTWW